MFKKMLIANRGDNGRAADVSTNCLPQTAQQTAARRPIA